MHKAPRARPVSTDRRAQPGQMVRPDQSAIPASSDPRVTRASPAIPAQLVPKAQPALSLQPASHHSVRSRRCAHRTTLHQLLSSTTCPVLLPDLLAKMVPPAQPAPAESLALPESPGPQALVQLVSPDQPARKAQPARRVSSASPAPPVWPAKWAQLVRKDSPGRPAHGATPAPKVPPDRPDPLVPLVLQDQPVPWVP